MIGKITSNQYLMNSKRKFRLLLLYTYTYNNKRKYNGSIQNKIYLYNIYCIIFVENENNYCIYEDVLNILQTKNKIMNITCNYIHKL